MVSSLLLITGPSGCGKSTIAQKVVNQFNTSNINTKAILIHQDHYFTKKFITYKDRTDDSYEDESGVDWDRLKSDIVAKASSSPSTVYQSDNGNRNCNHDDNKNLVVVVEGHLLSSSLIPSSSPSQSTFTLYENCYDTVLVIFISCTKENCRDRRINRNPNRTKEECQELSTYYDTFVWPSFLIYGAATMQSFHDFLISKVNDDENTSGRSNRNCSSDYDNRPKNITIVELENNNDDDDEGNTTNLNQIADTIITKLMTMSKKDVERKTGI